MPEKSQRLHNIPGFLQDYPFERLSALRIAGYTLYCTWVLGVFYSTFLYVSADDFRYALYLNLFVSMLALALVLILVASLLKRANKWVLSKWVIIPTTSVMAVATATLIFVDSNTTLGFVLTIVSACLTGFSSGLLFLGWIRIFTDVGSRVAMVEACLSWLLGAVLCLILFFQPDIFSSIVVVVLALAGGLLLRLCAHKRPGRPTAPRKTTLPKKTSRLLQRSLLAAVSLGFVGGFADVISGYRLFDIPEFFDIILLIGIVVLSLVALAVMVLSKRTPVMNVYRYTFLVIALGCLSILFMGNNFTYQYTLILGGYICFMIILMAVCINVSSFYSISVIRLAGFAFGALYTGEVLGSFAGHLLSSLAQEELQLGLFTFLLTGALIFAGLFLFNERDLAETRIGLFTNSDDERLRLEQPGDDLVVEVLEEVAREYALSARERDVLPLIYKGRTIARMQEELFISAGTVSTHTRHIYQKIGVKNRQELLDLIDSRTQAQKVL